MKTVKRYTGNNWLLAIRKKLGLSQEQMASLLKMSRSAYCTAEQGRRTLPTVSLLQAAQLEINLAAEPSQPEHANPHPAKHHLLSGYRRRYDLQFARESVCRLKSRKPGTNLVTMKTLYQRTREWLKLIEGFIKQQQDDMAAGERWKKKQQQAIKTLNSCSLPAQVLLQSRISLLEAEAELYKNMQEQLKKELPDFFLEEEIPDAEEPIEH